MAAGGRPGGHLLAVMLVEFKREWISKILVADLTSSGGLVKAGREALAGALVETLD